MKSLLTFFIILMISFSFIKADETGGKFSIGALGGLNVYIGDVADYQYKPFGKLNFSYWASDYIGLEVNGGTGFLQANDKANWNFKTWYTNIGGLLKVKPWPGSILNPYIAIGGEYLKIDPQDEDGNPLPTLADDFNKNQWAVPFGGGLALFLSETIAIDFEVLYHYALTDYLDGWKSGESNDGFITAGLGLSFYFGQPTDSDGDGIPDNIDKDTYHAEDMDGFEDEDGVPDLDNDQDGIQDRLDKAPNQAEDKDGFQDEDGAPDLDNDGDGILDSSDECPGTDQTLKDGIDTKEDIDGYQDDDGCPDPDNDGDGIADMHDGCPDSAETFNDYEDDDGCPDIKPEVAVEKGQALVLDGINFASGSARLTQNSMTILDKVVRTLRKNPDIEVEIRGYTDNTGSYEGNVRISQKRADSVRDYLIKNGIPFSHIRTRGYGPENPIAPNNTANGRAKNRRIEFYRIK